LFTLLQKKKKKKKIQTSFYFIAHQSHFITIRTKNFLSTMVTRRD
jgi:cellobiose-specific phosphotransferase system component IIA